MTTPLKPYTASAIDSPMSEQQLFNQTRRRLASWYAGIMGLILALFSFCFYEAVDLTYRDATDRELESIAGRLHDSLEPTLEKSGVLPASSLQYLPESCVVPDECFQGDEPLHVPGTRFQGSYYIRLLNPAGKIVAVAGLNPEGIPLSPPAESWHTLEDRNQNRYRQRTLALHNPKEPLWGYLQVGSSLQEADRYLATVRLALLVGLPVSLGLIGLAAWWLAGRAMRPIYQSYQQMQQFTADAAHELRTPIAAAQATVESVSDTPNLSSQEAQEAFQVLSRQHRRLASLTQDLLFLTRLDRQQPTAEIFCLQDIVADVAEELAALAIAQQLKLQINLPSKPMLWIQGNEAQIYRLLFNLIINAFQHTHPNGDVTVSLTTKDQKACIRVTDTGIGISPDLLKKIFDRFYRVGRDRSRQSGGSGLGLAIAQAIAQMHQGKITVESQLGKGSTFSVYLPITTVQSS